MLSHTLVAFPTNYKQKIKMMEKKKRKKERAIAYAMHKQKKITAEASSILTTTPVCSYR